MANFLERDPYLVQLVEGVQADLINAYPKMCRIYYPPKLVSCSNCVNGATWKTGGPMPFTFGTCPLCNSKTGYIAQEVTADIKVLIAWKPSQWTYPVKNLAIQIPNSYIETKGFYVDVPKIKNADHIAVLSVDGFTHYNFKLAGEPIDQGTISQGKFFLAPWVRI